MQEDKNSADRYLDTLKWKYRHHTDWVTTVKWVEGKCWVLKGLEPAVLDILITERPQGNM